MRNPGDLSASGASFLRGVGDLNPSGDRSRERGRGGSSDELPVVERSSVANAEAEEGSSEVEHVGSVANVASLLADALRSALGHDVEATRKFVSAAMRELEHPVPLLTPYGGNRNWKGGS